MIHAKREQILGLTLGKLPPPNKDTYWWNTSVQEAVSQKNLATERLDVQHTDENNEVCKKSKKKAQRVCAIAKSEADQDIYDQLKKDKGKEIF